MVLDAEDWDVVIHPDLGTVDGVLWDYKSGGRKEPGSVQAQLGLYALVIMLVLNKHFHSLGVKHFFKPGSKTDEAPEAVTVHYDVDGCISHAIQLLQSFFRALAQAESALHKNEDEPFVPIHDEQTLVEALTYFTANPSSNLCKRRFCAIFGTDACAVTKGLD